MTDKLPPQLLALFQPRPPVRYIPLLDDSPEQRATKRSTISGLAAFLPQLDEYKENDVYEATESWLQQRDRKRLEKQVRRDDMQKDGFEGFKPQNDAKIKGDPLRTLFVGRLSYEAKEQDLEREFGRFGTVERIRIVRDDSKDELAAPDGSKPTTKKKKKPHRGYAFIVFERERDMKAAYKETDGLRIKDRRVVVDVERGRMVPGWRPRRFGGGLGGRGYTKQAPAKPTFGQPPPGGFQGQAFRSGGYGGRGSGFRGGGYRGDRAGGYGGRSGVGYHGSGGFGGRQAGAYGAPQGAPSGPGGGRSGGYGGGSNGSDDRRNGYGGGRDHRGQTGSNREPLGGRDRGYDDRDRHGGGGGRRDDDYGSRKRYHDNDYDDPRKRRY
ncbi:hypothetical protein DV736_g3389, partial [Chaetothyriales sp. CBS 134916]